MSPATERDTANDSASVYLLATLDTKGPEAAFVAAALGDRGCRVTIVDCGCLNAPTTPADIGREEVLRAAGASLDALQAQGDRGQAVAAAAEGAARIVRRAWDDGKLAGVLALGGSAGTTIGTAAMRRLPVGAPKVMVSTLASGDCRPYVGDKDICMFNAVVDIAGVNRLSRLILHNAAMAVAGMSSWPPPPVDDDKPLVAATMFGVTTPCVQRAREVLERAGYEVLVFHATGSGGQAMESLIDEGLIAGVLDLTTTELADELVGGVLSAGSRRLTAAARNQVPQVVSGGALDMVNFGPRDTVPAEFADRLCYEHNATVTLIRTTPEECRQLGAEIGRKLSEAADAEILLPRDGLSAIDGEGQPFDSLEAREALAAGAADASGATPVKVLPLHINDPEFAEAAAEQLLRLMEAKASRRPAVNAQT